MSAFNIWHITGKNDELISFELLGKGLHQDVINPFIQLQTMALKYGFELAIVSAYRSFDRQLHIWNAKACGERDVVDSNGNIVNMEKLTPWQQVQAILRWSALPGASRHHWGTDIDIYDKAAVNENYQPILSPEEVDDTGPFGPMHCWLDQQIINTANFGFFRPYADDCGGVAPERWHISYAPIAAKYQSQLTVDGLIAAIINEPLMLKDVVIEHIEEIYQQFVHIPLDIYPSTY